MPFRRLQRSSPLLLLLRLPQPVMLAVENDDDARKPAVNNDTLFTCAEIMLR